MRDAGDRRVLLFAERVLFTHVAVQVLLDDRRDLAQHGIVLVVGVYQGEVVGRDAHAEVAQHLAARHRVERVANGAMQAVDTTGVAPMSHPQDLIQRLRADAVTETNRREAYQAVAPEAEKGLYLVPKVIE